MAMVRLLADTAVIGGGVVLEGSTCSALPGRRLRRVRGRKVAYIFQEPMTSLNPVLTVGKQIGEVLRVHLGMSRRDARARAIELLRLVGIRLRSGASTSTRTSSRAACASA